jgi:type IV pilus assembly protein PilA
MCTDKCMICAFEPMISTQASLRTSAHSIDASGKGVEVNMTSGRNLVEPGNPRKSRGFSLIELLVVVAVILIIAAIAIPNFMKAKQSANESATVSSIHAINTGEIAYSSSCPSIGFSASLTELNVSVLCVSGTNQIDSTLAAGTKSGYVYTYTPGATSPTLTYDLNVDPLNRGVTGTRSFYSSEVSVTHYNQSATATVNDNVIQ